MSGTVIQHRLVSTLLFFCLTLLQPSLQAADQEYHYDRVKLQSYAAMEVDNDTLIAILYAQKEGNELALLTDSVNRQIAQAVSEAESGEDIKIQTLSYQTSPIYQQQQFTGWRVRQSIRLESMHSDRLSKLLGRLQSTLALESISYAISPSKRQAIEEQLTVQAIDSFRQRAHLVTKRLERSDYRLVEMTIQTSDRTVQPYRMRANMMALEGAAVAPTLQAGSQNIRVEIDGTIELQLQ